MLRRWIIAAVVLLMAAFPGLAQVEGLIAYVQDGELFLIGPDIYVQVTRNDQRSKQVWDARWSLDGSRLAFVQQVEGAGSESFFSRNDLFVIDVNNIANAALSLQAAVEDVATSFPPAWAEDGSLYFVRDNPSNMSAASPEEFMMDIFRLSDGGVQSVASAPFGVGCGGGVGEPDQMLYNSEAGFGGNATVFLATRYGLLMSLDCSGVGLQLVGFDGRITRLGAQLGRASLAADGRTLAAIALDYSSFPPLTTLYLYDLATLMARQIPTVYPPDQLSWGGDGALYYSSSVPSGQLFSAEEAALISQAQGYDMSFITPEPIPAYRVTVNRIDLADGSEMEVDAHSASLVGRLRPAPGGVAYSVIGSLEVWGRGLIDGSIDPMSEDYYENWTNYVKLESLVFSADLKEVFSLGYMPQMEIAP